MFNEHKPPAVIPMAPRSATWQRRRRQIAGIGALTAYGVGANLYANHAWAPGTKFKGGVRARRGLALVPPIAAYAGWKIKKGRANKRGKK